MPTFDTDAIEVSRYNSFWSLDKFSYFFDDCVGGSFVVDVGWTAGVWLTVASPKCNIGPNFAAIDCNYKIINKKIKFNQKIFRIRTSGSISRLLAWTKLS
jgi:hypothetical protein